jgi:hypothetical protein
MAWSVVEDGRNAWTTDRFSLPLAAAVPNAQGQRQGFQALHPPNPSVFAFADLAPILNPGGTLIVDLPFAMGVAPGGRDTCPSHRRGRGRFL